MAVDTEPRLCSMAEGMMGRMEDVSRSRKPGKHTRKKGPVEFEESQDRFLRERPLARTHLSWYRRLFAVYLLPQSSPIPI